MKSAEIDYLQQTFPCLYFIIYFIYRNCIGKGQFRANEIFKSPENNYSQETFLCLLSRLKPSIKQHKTL